MRPQDWHASPQNLAHGGAQVLTRYVPWESAVSLNQSPDHLVCFQPCRIALHVHRQTDEGFGHHVTLSSHVSSCSSRLFRSTSPAMYSSRSDLEAHRTRILPVMPGT